jgi:hypothetical protein
VRLSTMLVIDVGYCGSSWQSIRGASFQSS